MRILIVDDKQAVRTLLVKIFTRAGYEVKTAVNAPEAAELLAAESFDALLSDVSLSSTPPVDGHGLVRWAARHCPRVRSVLMSAEEFECDDCPIAAGCPKLRKPFRMKDALAAVEKGLKAGSL